MENTQVSFKFEGDYRVYTNYPYTKYFVRWGCTLLGEVDFPEADSWQPERTVTIARARKCLNKFVIKQKVNP